MSANDSQLLGVVLLVRHGDRQGFYQTPTTYGATATQITPLGNVRHLPLSKSTSEPTLALATRISAGRALTIDLFECLFPLIHTRNEH